MWIKYQNSETKEIKSFNLDENSIYQVMQNSQGTWIRLEEKLDTAVEIRTQLPINPEPTIIQKDEPISVKDDPNMMLVGYAVITVDRITGLRLWSTFNHEGKFHTDLSPMQPLVFPLENKNLPVGTRIDWYAPKPK